MAQGSLQKLHLQSQKRLPSIIGHNIQSIFIWYVQTILHDYGCRTKLHTRCVAMEH